MPTASSTDAASLPHALDVSRDVSRPRRSVLPPIAIPWRQLGLSLCTWTAFGILLLLQSHLAILSSSAPPLTASRVAMIFGSMWVWAVLTLPILWLAARFPADQWGWPRYLAIHGAFSVGFTCIGVILEATVARVVQYNQSRSLATWALSQVFINVYSYFAILGIGHAIRYYALFTERRLRAAALETELLRTRLQALEMQLRPHFLFNTLHTVSSLVRMDRSKEAIRMLAGLGELLRSVLRSEGQEVPLEQELDFIERYLGIEQVRFQNQIEVRVDVDPGVRSALVPHLLLQPLVENALHHGLSDGTPGLLQIRVSRDGEMLVLQVRDSGDGPRDVEEGVGLGNTRARLQHLYGHAHQFELTRADGGGALVRVALPYHTEPQKELTGG
jgi:two-component system, LytTR family, sensor kinase